MSETKYWGPIRADIFYNQKKVILTCKRHGPEANRLMPGTMGRVAAWGPLLEFGGQSPLRRSGLGMSVNVRK